MALLYVDRQSLEVLGRKSGKVRVTRQLIEVLHLPGAGGTEYEVAAEDQLSLTEEVAAIRPWYVSAEDQLAWTEEIVAARPWCLNAEEQLAFTEEVVDARPWPVAAEDRLRFFEQTTVGRPWRVEAEDYLQQAFTDYDPVTLEPITTYRGLRDEAAKVLVPNAPKLVADRLLLTEAASCVVVHIGARDCSAEDALEFTEAAYLNQTEQTRDILEISEEAVVQVVKPAGDALVLAEEAAVNVVRNLAAEDVLVLCEALAFSGPVADLLHVYHPFVGEGTSGPTPPTACPIPIVGIGPCRLCYPVSHPTINVPLRSPEFGNKDRLQFNRISRETRGGTLIVFADPIWPKVQTMVLTFRGLSGSQVQDYLAFLSDHLGLEVGFLDWEGFYWKGVILNPSEPTTQDGKEIYTVSFEFECEPAIWEP